MAIKLIKCPQCGGTIEADTEKQYATCQNCGKTLKKKQKVNHQPTETANLSVPEIKTKELTEIDKLFIRAKDMELESDYATANVYYNKILDIDPLNEKARKLLYRNKNYLQTVKYDTNDYSVNKANQIQGVINYSNKNKYVAFALAIFLGFLGAHNFYLGKTGKACLQLALSIISMSMGIIATLVLPFLGTAVFAVWIWAIIEGILIITGKTTDGYGFKLK